MIGVYVHIPWCRTRCPYCDFLSIPIAGSVPNTFVEAVRAEIAAFQGTDVAGTVFIGGGTPSLLPPMSLGRILAAVRKRFSTPSPEVTIEANPDDVSPALAGAWRSLGVTRVSLGVQSFDDRVLSYLGRRHGADAARRACDTVARHFDDWSLDLIFGVCPVTAWEATLEECARLSPPHVSVYGLTYEQGTPFGARGEEAVSDETWLELYRAAESRLQRYDHYEISNYARPGHLCRHNLVYWHNEEYAGFGPGAYSFIAGVRARNLTNIEQYIRRPGAREEAVPLADREVRVETVVQHMRLRDGLPRRYYADRFGNAVDDDFGPALQALAQRGLLEDNGTRVQPTRAGFELNNEIGLAIVQ